MIVPRGIRIPIAALVLLAGSANATLAQSASSSADRALLREILQQLVEIPTSAQEAATPRAARALADRLVAAGVPLQDVRVLGPDPRTGNLVARVRGRDRTARPVLLMAHLDVVPPRPLIGPSIPGSSPSATGGSTVEARTTTKGASPPLSRISFASSVRTGSPLATWSSF